MNPFILIKMAEGWGLCTCLGPAHYLVKDRLDIQVYWPDVSALLNAGFIVQGKFDGMALWFDMTPTGRVEAERRQHEVAYP